MAAGITAIAIWGSYAQIGFPTPGRRIAHYASLPAIPAAFAVAMLGLGSGPEGFPNQEDVHVYVLTFLLWWAAIHLARSWLSKRVTLRSRSD
jgi:hypothetical protein